jgi:starch phosphorylase
MSLIDEGGERYVRMASLACLGSHKVNGVAALHSELLRRYTLRDFAEFWPGKFGNVTNGVTPRRFLLLSNPGLSRLITEAIGDGWPAKLDRLRELEAVADDPAFQERWRQVKLENKRRLAALIQARTGITVDPASLFDIQVKRIHEYKRQHLNALHMISLYFRLKRDPAANLPPRTCMVGGKAAPGYRMAKLLIKLINSVGDVINQDPDMQGRLRIVYFPDFNVKSGHHIYPAADLSEQISTAGMEASGTGNMKFAMNGALTIGTLDGANIEIREEVGADNFFLFGLTADEVRDLKATGYSPRTVYEAQPALREAIDWLVSGAASRGDAGLFRPLVDVLLHHDPHMLFADYVAYMECQERVNTAWRSPAHWTRMSILNVARIGKFSSDRSIGDYCRDIWGAKPVPVG